MRVGMVGENRGAISYKKRDQSEFTQCVTVLRKRNAWQCAIIVWASVSGNDCFVGPL